MPLRPALAAVLVGVLAGTARGAGEHQMLAAEQELKIARDHLQAAGTDYGGHRRAAMDHLDEALREIREAIKFARSGPPTTEHGGKHPPREPDEEPDED